MKKISVLFLLIIMVILCSCGSVYNFMDNKKIMQLEIGQSKKQILDIFGNPNFRDIKDNIEIWQYRYSTYEGYDFLKLTFDENNKVKSFESYFLPLNQTVITQKEDTKTD